MRRLFIIIGTLAAVAAFGQNSKRTEWNDGWLFCKGDDAAYSLAGFDDSSWRELSVPHDWGVESTFEQSLPGETGKLEWWGTAWYRKHLPGGGRYFIDFGGVMSGAKVYVNGVEAASRPYGYSSFRVDTEGLLTDGDNVVAVRVENLPNSSRWYPGAGIYRPVYICPASPVGVGETWVTVDSINDKGTASVRVRTTIRGGGNIEVISESPLEGRPVFGTAPESLEQRLTGPDACDG